MSGRDPILRASRRSKSPHTLTLPRKGGGKFQIHVAQGLGCQPVIRLLSSALGRLSRRRRLLAVALGLVVLTASSLVLGHMVVERCGGWSGCDANGLPLGSVTVRDLERHPEATLYYPGATVIVHGGIAEQDWLLGSPGSAYTSSTFATHDNADRIYAWYQSWLSAHGWRTVEMLQSTAELSVKGWKRGSREVMIISMLDPERWRTAFENTIPSGQTIIRTRYGVNPVGG